MFDREVEAMLTLTAMSVFEDRSRSARDRTRFFEALSDVPDMVVPDQRQLDAWLTFNRPILRDRMKLGPIGFGIWLNLLMDDLSEFSDKMHVLDLVQRIRDPKSGQMPKRRPVPARHLAIVA